MNCIDCEVKIDSRGKRCKTCYDLWRESTKTERAQKFKEYQKEWYEENKERLITKGVERTRNLPKDTRKSYIIKSKYGIDIFRFKEMLKESNNKCTVCGKEHSDELPLNIDHDHKTGEVRGLLCKKCNYGLGFFGDDINLLNNAIKYLKVWENTKRSKVT